MFHKLRDLYGCKLAALDGMIGHVSDFYFDERNWMLRYMVVDVGDWLVGRKVLLSPHAFGVRPFGQSDVNDTFLRVELSQRQIESSPPMDTHRPVSRQYEEAYYRHFGWPNYWEDQGFAGQGSECLVMPPLALGAKGVTGHKTHRDQHLHGAKGLVGYHIEGLDGGMGSVIDFQVDDKTWAITNILVQAGHWFLTRELLLLTRDIERISYEESTIFVRLLKADFEHARSHDVVHAGGA